jgi:hypothetical protein
MLAGPQDINAGIGGSGKLGVEPLSVRNCVCLPQLCVCFYQPEHEEYSFSFPSQISKI